MRSGGREGGRAHVGARTFGWRVAGGALKEVCMEDCAWTMHSYTRYRHVTCMEHSCNVHKNVYGIRKLYAWGLHRISMKCVPSMHGYACNRPVTCIEPAGKKQGGCLEYAWAMHVICTGYAGTMMEYSWNGGAGNTKVIGGGLLILRWEGL